MKSTINKHIYSAFLVVQLDVTGFNVMKKFIYAVETRGVELFYYSLLIADMKDSNTSIHFAVKFKSSNVFHLCLFVLCRHR